MKAAVKAAALPGVKGAAKVAARAAAKPALKAEVKVEAMPVGKVAARAAVAGVAKRAPRHEARQTGTAGGTPSVRNPPPRRIRTMAVRRSAVNAASGAVAAGVKVVVRAERTSHQAPKADSLQKRQ